MSSLRPEPDYAAARRLLFEQMRAVDSSRAFFDVQVELAEEIRRTEAAALIRRDPDARFHLSQLRLMGDALAWEVLHPYAIRKLAINSNPPPSLNSQGAAFDRTIELAREHAEAGAPVVIADLTNCLTVSDVVICTDRERPLLAESGGSIEHMGKGRKGRQMRRALSVLALLYKGNTTFEGDPAPTMTVEVDDERSYSWSEVEQASQAALADGRGGAVVSESDVMWAIRGDQDNVDPPADIREVADRFGQGCVGVNSRMLEEPSPFIPPPLVWPVSETVRWALFERNVRIIHLIDLDGFSAIKGQEGRISEVRSKAQFLEDFSFVVDVGGSSQQISRRFLDDVLYGFETIESAANLIITFAARCAELEGMAERGEVDAEPVVTPPHVIMVSDVEEARRLAEDDSSRGSYGYVAMPKELYDQLQREARESSDA